MTDLRLDVAYLGAEHFKVRENLLRTQCVGLIGKTVREGCEAKKDDDECWKRTGLPRAAVVVERGRGSAGEEHASEVRSIDKQ